MSLEKQKIAMDAIKASSGTDSGEYGVDLFVEHHIEELNGEEWKKSLGEENPSKEKIINSLVFESAWDDDCVYDFTLPNNVTDCVVSVRLDDNGEVEEISMES